MLMVFVLAVLMVAPTGGVAFTADQTVTQQNWRAAYYQFGDNNGLAANLYKDDGQVTYTLMSNGLHEELSFSPDVTNLRGADLRYHFDGANYLLQKQVVTYSYNYGTTTTFSVVNLWDGWVSFDGMPISDTNMAVTSGYVGQWILVKETPPATWDAQPAGGWWLIGFSVYVYGHDFSSGQGTPLLSPDAFWAAAGSVTQRGGGEIQMVGVA